MWKMLLFMTEVLKSSRRELQILAHYFVDLSSDPWDYLDLVSLVNLSTFAWSPKCNTAKKKPRRKATEQLLILQSSNPSPVMKPGWIWEFYKMWSEDLYSWPTLATHRGHVQISKWRIMDYNMSLERLLRKNIWRKKI